VNVKRIIFNSSWALLELDCSHLCGLPMKRLVGKHFARKARGLVFAIAVSFSPSFANSLSAPNVVIRWNNAALQGVRDAKLGAPAVARALAIVHTCMYDAWSAYDDRAVGTQLHGALRRPQSERTIANQQQAISYAAYRALVDVMPVDADFVYTPLMKKLGYDPADNSTDIETPTGIGNVTCAAVLEFRHHDKSNQLGDLAPGQYSDWTGYLPANKPSGVPVTASVTDQNRWQPLTYVDSAGNLVTQRFVGAHWGSVTPFALSSGNQYRWLVKLSGPAIYGSSEYQEQAEELVQISAGLTDKQKMISEYWSDGPNSEQPPGHWSLFAQFVSDRDHHSVDDDVKMFFALTNAIFDAGIAAWDAKRAFDSVRPVTAISLLFHGKTIRAWGGPGRGTTEMDGSHWAPYQPTSFPTPPFPEFVSGHSSYSAAAAQILRLWTRNDNFGDSVVLPAGSSKIEPGLVPSQPVILKWPTFTDASNEAGMSRRYGGIHFRGADLAGRLLGRLVALEAWSRAQSYFDGTAMRPEETGDPAVYPVKVE
jgi:uncharacterized protein DUF6851/vanadium-dependent haloperoxidase-like protein